MLVIITFGSESFQNALPIVLKRGRHTSTELCSLLGGFGKQLLEAVRKTSMSVKLTGQRTWRSEKKEAHQTLAADDKPSSDYNSHKWKDRETYPPLPCKDEEFHAILDTMIVDGAIKPFRPYKVPTREEKNDPRYCRYHQFVGHPTTACQTLRRIL
ncbi:unnamed protein product [Prunus armeniaca]